MTHALLPNHVLLTELLVVASLNAGKEWLLSSNVGVPWALLRILAVGGLGVIVRELYTSSLQNKRQVEACFVSSRVRLGTC